jgi:hypothetical protein
VFLACIPLACGGGGGSGAAPAVAGFDFSGTWNGHWASANGIDDGALTLALVQTGHSLAGTASFAGSACFPGGTLTGTVHGASFTAQVDTGGVSVTLHGHKSGPGLANLGGTYRSSALGSCASDHGSLDATSSGSGHEIGSIQPQPDPSIGSRTFVVDGNHGGQAPALAILSVRWGRLVNVRDSSGVLQNTDMPIGEDIHSDGVDYSLEHNPITGETAVRILHPADTQAYVDAFLRLDQNLTPVLDKSLDPGELPPFTLLPRNGALVFQFDDLLDTATIAEANLHVLVGYPPLAPFDYRAVLDRNHGDLADADGDGVLEFHSTRAILDMTVSALESGQSSPPLPINELGLPAGTNASQANVGVRIPTHTDATTGQTTILANLAGHGLSFTGNGSHDGSVRTQDIVRALRSGGPADPSQGFLFDQDAPRVVGDQPVQLAAPRGSSDDPVTALDYDLDACALQPKLGDVIEQAGVYAEVTLARQPPSGGTVAGVHFRILFPIGGQLAAGPALIHTLWDPATDGGKEGCFVQYSGVAPGGSAPGQGVSTDAHVRLRFSEPMDRTTLTAFDNLPLLRVDPASSTPSARDYVVGEVLPSLDLEQYSFAPVLPLRHTQGSAADTYWVELGSGADGPRDLAGNPLGAALPTVAFTIDPGDASEDNAGLVFRFSSLDELGADGKPEWRGQFAWDSVHARVAPRPVTRLRATCDRTLPIPGQMPAFPQGVQTPLSGLGSKLNSLWRYCDVGYSLLDESVYNVDVEHLYWAPAGGNVIADSFDLFEIRLSHTRYLPDESIDSATLLPSYENSGLIATFAGNLLDPVNDPQRIVHPRQLGYVVDPADRKLSGTGAEQIMPYPLNRDLPVAQYQYYTWRDTALLARGAFNGPGAELPIVCTTVLGQGLSCFGCPFTGFGGSNPVPSIGLPLLMEFRCFPDSGALGLNRLDVNFAVNSSAKPNFRAFSTGGVNSSGQTIVVNPDLETVAHGGFNPNSNPPGAPTLGIENTVYLGEMDLVLRVSRMHSIWLDTQMIAPTYVAPVVEPRAADQPAGTQVELHFRAATAVLPPGANIATDANFVDCYGDPALCSSGTTCPLQVCSANGIPTFLQNDGTWRQSVTEIATARWFQARVTFVSNTETSLSPTLSALGFAYSQ